VNKVATAVQLRFDVDGCRTLADPVRHRLKMLAGTKLTRRGILVIEAKRFRTQERNRQDALDRLIALIRRAAQPVRPRKKTAPTPASKERKLAAKRRRSRIKALRGRVNVIEDQ